MGHIYTVLLPDIGEGVVEGEVIEWLKNEGDELSQDEPVVIVMTDKATVELPAPYPGVLQKIYYHPGEIAIKDKPLYDIKISDGVNISKIHQNVADNSCTAIKHIEKPLPQQCNKSKHEYGHQALATPATRKLAHQMGVDINTIHGSGPEGRVTVHDLQAYSIPKVISANKTVFESDSIDDIIEPIIGIPKIMSEHMMFSKQNIAHFSYFETIDTSRLIKMRTHFKLEAAKEVLKVTFMPFFIRALSLAMLKFPKFNSRLDLDNSRLIIHKHQHIGIAIASDAGLIVPVLKNTQEMSLHEIIRAYESLKIRAAEKKLTPSEMKGSTITLSNFGVFGGNGKWATPIINYPEVAILALSRIQQEPFVKHGQIIVREALNLSWSFNHQVIDGEMASKFSHYYGYLLENPSQLL